MIGKRQNLEGQINRNVQSTEILVAIHFQFHPHIVKMSGWESRQKGMYFFSLEGHRNSTAAGELQ